MGWDLHRPFSAPLPPRLWDLLSPLFLLGRSLCFCHAMCFWITWACPFRVSSPAFSPEQLKGCVDFVSLSSTSCCAVCNRAQWANQWILWVQLMCCSADVFVRKRAFTLLSYASSGARTQGPASPALGFLPFNLPFIFMSVRLHVYMCPTCIQCSSSPDEGLWSPRTRVSDGRESCGCWELTQVLYNTRDKWGWWGLQAAVRCAEKAQTARLGTQSRQVCLWRVATVYYPIVTVWQEYWVFTDLLICLAFKEKPKNVRFTIVVVIIILTYYYCERARVPECALMEPPCRSKMSELLCNFPEF